MLQTSRLTSNITENSQSAQFQDKLSGEIAMYIFHVPQSTQPRKTHQKDKLCRQPFINLFISVSFTDTFINIFHIEIDRRVP